MMYLTFISHQYSPSNNLQRAVKAFLVKSNRLFLDAKDLDRTKRAIIAQIERLNNHFPRCRPIEASWQPGYADHKNDWRLYLGQNMPICEYYLIQGLSINMTNGPGGSLLERESEKGAEV